MLYELIAVVRPGSLPEIKDIAKTAGMLVLQSGGVVRGFSNWGPFLLPRKTRIHQATHTKGHYFVMRFDSSGSAQSRLRSTLALDPRMVRFSVVKMGEKLEEVVGVSGRVRWKREEGESFAFYGTGSGFGGVGGVG
ncbi:MAG: hypothetical protein M1816_004765 [Peltula sp. TS41687]|nr:MAG: hypothetical protein M1816_004765 [Peltula sp. TS41687]